MTTTKMDPFDDVPDLTDVTRENDRTRAPTLRETVREITQLLRRKADDDPEVGLASMRTVQVVIEAYVELVMREAVRTGNVRLPQGWGSFKLQKIAGSTTPRSVPNPNVDGAPSRLIPRKPTVKVRYIAGVTMDDLLQRQGAVAYEASRKTDRDYYFPEKEVPTADDLAATE